MSNRLEPLSPPFEPEIAEKLARYPQIDGYLLLLFRTFANSARFLEKAVPNLLDRGSPVDLRTRELVILRTTANLKCEYEWGVHVSVFAKAARLSPHEIEATCAHTTQVWSGVDRMLIDIVDQLCQAGNLDDLTEKHFRQNWNREQQLEILALVGTYTTISLVANVARVPMEEFAARFPSKA